MPKNKYQIGKERARQKAIEWQTNFYNHNYSYEELAYEQRKLDKLATRYGLIKEFRENGI